MQWLAALAAVFALACSGKSGDSEASATARQAGAEAGRAACDPHAERVRGLYRAQLDAPVEGEIDDATALILDDCYRDAERLAPCIAAAESVEQLESRCVIPLDDQGLGEHAEFGGGER